VPQPPPPITCVKAWLADWDLPAPLRVRGLSGGFTSHVWRLETGESRWLAKLAYQPRGDVENGFRAATIVDKSGLNTGPPLLTRNGDLTRLVEYPIQQFHALAVLRFVEGQPLDWGANGSLATVVRLWEQSTGLCLTRVHSNCRTTCFRISSKTTRGTPARTAAAHHTCD